MTESYLPATRTGAEATVGEPVGPLVATVRHPLLALVPVIVLVALALVIGLSHRATYTADALVNVGEVNVPPYTLQGVIVGNAALATNYARAINAPAVYEGAARRARVGASTARDALSASPVPEGTLIRIEAKRHDKAQAIAIANAGARSLIRYAQRLNRDPSTSRLLTQYRALQDRVAGLQTRVDTITFDPRIKPAPKLRLLQPLKAELQTVELQAVQTGNSYGAALANRPGSNILSFLSPATTASSDYTSVLEQVLAVGAIAGIVLGAMLALASANRDWLRRIG